jgi:hypothetical protein
MFPEPPWNYQVSSQSAAFLCTDKILRNKGFCKELLRRQTEGRVGRGTGHRVRQRCSEVENNTDIQEEDTREKETTRS